MDNKLLKICIGGLAGLAGLGLGLFASQCKIDQLEIERDELELQNKCLTAEREIMQISNDNLRATNELFTNLLLQEKKDEGT